MSKLHLFSKGTIAVIAFLILLLGYTGYSIIKTYFPDLSTAQKRDNVPIGPFDQSNSYEQQFVSNTSDLSLIEVSFISGGSNIQNTTYHITLKLQNSGGKVIKTESYNIPRLAESFDLALEFEPQRDWLNAKYNLVEETDALPRMVFPLGSEYNTYTEGQLFYDGVAIDQDLALFTYSTPSLMILIKEVASNSLPRFGYIMIMGLGILGLGYLIGSLFWKLDNIIEIVVYSLAIGISTPTIFLVFLSILRIPLIIKYLAISFVMVILILSALHLFHIKKIYTKELPINFQLQETLILGFLLMLAFFSRLSQISDLSVPAGVDALAHEKILERIVKTQSIPLDSLYHLGFHSDVFLVHTFLNIPLPEAMLLFGQFLSIISGLCIYVLAHQVFSKYIIALIPTVLYWFASPFPSYLVGWSRYPFLQGLTLLPVALALSLKGLDSINENKYIIAIIIAGIFLSHYGAFLLFIILLLAIIIGQNLKNILSKRSQAKSYLTAGIIVAPLILLLVIKLYFALHQGKWETFISASRPQYTIDDYTYLLDLTLLHGGWAVWILGLTGFIVYTTKDRRFAVISFGWLLVMLFLNWLQIMVFGHSASSILNLIIFLSLPLSMLAGYVIQWGAECRKWIVYLAIIVISIAGSYNMSSIINPRNIIFFPADQKAIDWIQKYTKPDSTILISSAMWDTNYQPADGGGWITSLTGRKTVFPKSDADYTEINQYINQIQPDLIYFGVGYGELSPFIIKNKALVYSDGGDYIYEKEK